MAEQDKDQQTEEATPRKKEKMREEGRVALSQDVTQAAVYAAGVAAIIASLQVVSGSVADFAMRQFRLTDYHHPMIALQATVPLLGRTMVPVLMAVMIAGIAASVIQTRGLFQMSLVMPKLDRLDPMNNLKRVLPTGETLTEIGKQILKVVVLSWLIYWVLSSEMAQLTALSLTHPAAATAFVLRLVGKALFYSVMTFVALGALDFFISQRKFNNEAKMSKQEVKDEHKQDEGDPQVKRRMRRQMREAIKRRAMNDIKQATVLVVNPTHVAVALRYDVERDPAPIMLARGLDELALQMRQEARKHGVPIVENRPLARSLYSNGKPGQTIPVDLYKAAAEVIAHVMRLKAGAA